MRKLAAILTLSLVAIAGPGAQSVRATSEPDGTLDLPFDAGNFTNGQIDAAVLQPDGKLLIAGRFSKVHGVPRYRIARLNTDGTLDLSFDPGSGPLSFLKGMILQTDGKIIIFGPNFGIHNGVNRPAGIARLNSNGSLDTAFDPGRGISVDGQDDGFGGATNPGTVWSAVLEPDGKIVVTGQFSFVITGPGTSVPRSCIARFNSNGSFDPSFDPGTGFTHTVLLPFATRAVRQSSGKIIVQGDFDTFDGHPGLPGFARLNPDGSFDDTFTPGTATGSFAILGLFVQSDDRVVVFGNFTTFNGVACNSIVRLTSSGVVDSGFSTVAFQEYRDIGRIDAVTQQPNGKLIVAGYFHSLGGIAANNIVRLETNGARDASFDSVAAGPSSFNISAVLVRPSDGKIFAGGYFSTYGGAPRNNMAWVNIDGTVDSVFTGLSGATDYAPQIYALATQADGKILVGGFFSSFNGVVRSNLVRLNPDSTIDPSFSAALATERSVRALLIQPDGRILIAGNFVAVNGVARGRIARLNSDGTLDPSFDPGTGADQGIFAFAQDSAGNVYVGGAFESFNGVPRLGVAKLGPTGALDSTFNQAGGGANSTVLAMAQPGATGGIVIGGQFSLYDGQPARRIARLNVTTGALDTAFTPPGSTGFSSSVHALALAPDGKYYVGGLFSSFNGVARSRVARLNSDGTLDAAFVGPFISSTVGVLPCRTERFSSAGLSRIRLADLCV